MEERPMPGDTDKGDVRRGTKTTRHNVDVQNEARSRQVRDTESYEGARPKTSGSQKYGFKKDKREYDRLKRSKSTYDLGSKDRWSELNNGSNRLQEGGFQDHNQMRSGRRIGSLDRRVSKPCDTYQYLDGRDRHRNSAEHKQYDKYGDSNFWKRGQGLQSCTHSNGTTENSSNNGKRTGISKIFPATRYKYASNRTNTTVDGRSSSKFISTSRDSDVSRSNESKSFEFNCYTDEDDMKGRQDNVKKLHGSRIIGYPFLKDLVGKDPGYIILELTKVKSSLKDCIARASKEWNFLELLLRVLSDAFTSSTTPNLLIGLFEILKEVGFFDTVMLYLIDIMTMTNDGKADCREVEKVLQNILSIITEQMTRNPSSFHIFGRTHTVIGQVIENLMKRWTVDDAILSKYKELTEERKRLDKGIETNHKSQYNQKPPDDFRQYPVAPSPEEITGTVRPFLRPNKVEGRYDDLDHYLDVQFRLLREDFVGPLREGITEYIKLITLKTQSRQTKDRDLKKLDIKIYENVRVHTPVVTEHGLCYKLQLEMNKRLRQIKWAFSKRLIYGSMVCLTDNDFSSFFLATVVGRDEQDIQNGFLIVHFEQEDLKTHDLLQKVFRMAESSAYFESYRHVLSSIQTFSQGDLPFEKYIVSCEEFVDQPAYLTKDCVYDLRPLTSKNYELQSERRLQSIGTRIRALPDFQFPTMSIEAKSVPVCNLSSWPPKELLHLDESQYTAVQTALTKEFVIIQGPPGTGKTYIGLQIVKALLHNKSVWANARNEIRPMLVVCYTNHALDQFLEGIFTFFKGDILRVGGRSDSTVLRNCNLKYYRQQHQPPRTKLGKLQLIRKQSRLDLEDQSLFLQELATSIEVYNSEIISEVFLKPEIGTRLYNSLVKGFRGNIDKRKGFSYIVKWLGIKHIQDMCRRRLQSESAPEEDKFIYVEDDLKQKQRNLSIDSDEENRKNLKEKAKQLLKKIRHKSHIVFYVDAEKCSVKDANAAKELLDEVNFFRLLKATIERKISDPDVMSQEEEATIQDVWRLNHNTKWKLYRRWIQQLCMKQYNKVEEKRNQFEEASERYREALVQEEKEIMSQASVIGMTTSGAARYQSVLRQICPRIIVVEEAAEVLEAHIITTLSKGCEHLILIGDHKQLRPNPNVYKLATKYKLDISLFERMIKNRMNFNCLELQHRMRPEISTIVRHIYPDLQDHEYVKGYPNVAGISENVFLINHEHPETTDEDLKSYSNLHEAQYVAALCRYLLLQGYKKLDITILTTYTGQLMCMRKFMLKDEFQGVKVTVVDNYQGEENKIIILSLVRSNDVEKIGFLKTENRICVALSRAKVGFYILGNFHHLAAHSSLWKKIVEDMKDKGSFGNGLKLYCQNHLQKQPLIATRHVDFSHAPEGGCSEICNIRLKCGHKCRRHCHILDKTHEEYKCTQSCTNILCDLGHVCPSKCYVTCGQCVKQVSKTIPSCGHKQKMQCCVKPYNFKCKKPCEIVLECGHRCDRTCGEPHTYRCMTIVNFEWNCGHTDETKCWMTHLKTIQEKCPHPCDSILECEHICGGTCGKCFSGRVHQPCQQNCNRVLVCGHACKSNCSNCPPCKENCQNRCVHSVCDKLCGEPCVPCKEKCSWQCQHYKCSKLCSEPCNRPRCNKACQKRLEKCGHLCIGLCGEPCPTLCRFCDEETVTEIFFGNEDEPDAKFVLLEDCNHIVESEKMDEYMEMDDEDLSIQVKTCPLCKTPIRKCLRYGKLINKVLTDIERVKKEIIGDDTRIGLVKSKLKRLTNSYGTLSRHTQIRMTRLRPSSDQANKLSMVRYKLENRLAVLQKRRVYSERQLNTIENQCMIAVAILDARRNIKQDTCTTENENERKILSFLKRLMFVILEERDVLTQQEIEDLKREIERGRIYAKYLKIIKTKKSINASEESKEANEDIRRIHRLVFDTKIFTEELKVEADECIETLNELLKVGGLSITEDERLEIVKAVQMSKGHWFKCPNNHIYVIGDCGGANQKSTCPECKAEIGGESHRLIAGNKLAPEMDGAKYAAYSEEANNMANFDLNNLH